MSYLPSRSYTSRSTRPRSDGPSLCSTGTELSNIRDQVQRSLSTSLTKQIAVTQSSLQARRPWFRGRGCPLFCTLGRSRLVIDNLSTNRGRVVVVLSFDVKRAFSREAWLLISSSALMEPKNASDDDIAAAITRTIYYEKEISKIPVTYAQIVGN